MRPILSLITLSAGLTLAANAFAQPAPFAQEPFKDVPAAHVNFEAVEYLRVNNIVKGYPDATFRPTRKITRAEFVTLVTNPYFLSGRSNDCLKTHFSEHASTRVFLTDVKLDAWYAQDVCEAVVHEIVHGYADGTFKPLRPITFAEAAKVSASVFSISTEEKAGADEQWYVPYVKRLSDLKAIPTTIHGIHQEITRGEMAEILFRLKTSNNAKASARFGDLK